MQRFANAQPAGAVPGIGGLPGIAMSGASSASVRRGSALSRPIVYGCDGAAKIELNDFGATPGVVMLRLNEAVEASEGDTQ